ncbi:MAG: 16S rRNA (guanine(966)-N(2))-methyltransferase RsmD [Candidatus Neptunochlamydia sp.]|nr:16S rRNA (guanine(966)-N(2))-methyltransferase RsmD [Candidatus Neptunochlamydia sp.]
MRITGGFLKNQSLKTPKGDKTRPTSEKLRQSVFNIAQTYVENCTFLDLYAGSGAMGIEALSRGAKEATFIEKDRSALKILRENITELYLSPLTTLIVGDVLLLLKRLNGKTFDLIYIDPPYEKGLQEKTLVLVDNLHLLHIGGLLFVEGSCQKELEIPSLTTMQLQKKKKMGSTFLFQFQGIQ